MRADSIGKRLQGVRRRIDGACRRCGRSPKEITLVAVTKGLPPESVREAVAAGLRQLGENRVQEAAAKRKALDGLPTDVVWHMIGHLQTNKAKTTLRLFDIIHSVDTFHLAETLSRRATEPVPVFLEVIVAGEPSKYGFPPAELARASQAIARLPNLDLRGLMTVAPLAADPEDVRPVFRGLREMARALSLQELSMGMTNDFEVAIEEGATCVRIGRAIFGERRQP
ncbi:MAG: YggS family pyridoxal phosphate-dependent enzyme [Dehalococcoidia bacterium]